jgi:hypothetical protein
VVGEMGGGLSLVGNTPQMCAVSRIWSSIERIECSVLVADNGGGRLLPFFP